MTKDDVPNINPNEGMINPVKGLSNGNENVFLNNLTLENEVKKTN